MPDTIDTAAADQASETPSAPAMATPPTPTAEPPSAEQASAPQTPHPIAGFNDFGRLELQRLHNTRDLGGMPAADGRLIAPNRLIRSGALHGASKEDLQALLTRHQVKNVVDLRTDLERRHDPDPLGALPGVSYHAWAPFSQEAAGVTHGGGLMGDIAAFSQLNADPFGDIAQIYRRCVLSEEGQRAYRNLFELLASNPQGAILWHCTEGKDRTGIAAFLIELALGVTYENAKQDYLATNLFVSGWIKDLLAKLAKHPLLSKIDLDADAYLYAYVRYMDTAIDAVMGEYGSYEAYLKDALGVDGETRAALQAAYLSDVTA